jgi:hypothetical protein
VFLDSIPRQAKRMALLMYRLSNAKDAQGRSRS